MKPDYVPFDWEPRVRKLKEVHAIQGRAGNFDQSEYMRGMYNGLECAAAILDDREPEYKDAQKFETVEDCAQVTYTLDEAAAKLQTIQKRNNLNAVYREGEAGPGGAHHDYAIKRLAENGSEEDEVLLIVPFQRGPRHAGGSRHGALDTDLLEIVRDRMTEFQDGDYATRENAIALTHIEEALLWMNKRVEDRAERGVLGTTEK